VTSNHRLHSSQTSQQFEIISQALSLKFATGNIQPAKAMRSPEWFSRFLRFHIRDASNTPMKSNDKTDHERVSPSGSSVSAKDLHDTIELGIVPKPLYMAQSMKELEAHLAPFDLEFSNRVRAARKLRSPNGFVESLLELYRQARRAHREGDQEAAYLKYKSYVKACRALVKSGLYVRKNRAILNHDDYKKMQDRLPKAILRHRLLGRELAVRYAAKSSNGQPRPSNTPSWKANHCPIIPISLHPMII